MVIAIIVLSIIILLQIAISVVVLSAIASRAADEEKLLSTVLHDIEEQWLEDIDKLNELRTDGKQAYLSVGVHHLDENKYCSITRHER